MVMHAIYKLIASAVDAQSMLSMSLETPIYMG
jgi:hypothetical protein